MFDIDAAVEAVLGQIKPMVRNALILAAQESSDDTKAAILRAAGLDLPGTPPTPFQAGTPDRKPIVRSPRGLLSSALKDALRLQPGANVRQIEEYAIAWDNRLARKSVGNELRRQEGKLYRRDDHGGWYLLEGAMA